MRALDVMVQMPIVTAKVLSRQLDVSFQAASLALNALADKRVVRERTGYGRNRVFAAKEALAVLARPFGEEPGIALEGARTILGLEQRFVFAHRQHPGGGDAGDAGTDDDTNAVAPPSTGDRQP